MKYGIINSPEETTSCDKRDTEGERDMASEGGQSSEAATMAKQRQQSEVDAVIFSIQFYGKTIGEVGMMDQDLSELDWKKFKSYLFQNLLTINHQENICVSYSDEEGDKLPIDSDEEYREALKVAKKKAEMHDKLVLDITRQGGFPTVLSMVSSGIKKVSSSPPKEGGISFFKASSPPKEHSGFKAIGTERKLFQGFFMPDKGIDKLTGARPKDVRLKGEMSEQPPEWFTSYMNKFRAEICEEISERVFSKVTEALKNNSVQPSTNQMESQGYGLQEQLELGKTDAGDNLEASHVGFKKYFGTGSENADGEVTKKEDCENEEVSFDTLNSESSKGKKKDEKCLGVKRKKLIKEEERLAKEEGRLLKRQEKIERKKLILTSKYADEMDRASRTQEKVFAKMEGLRKKQFCSQEELSKLRKMVDKQQRFMSAEQRQQRRSERKAGYQKSGKAKKINIDNLCFPIDASLLHAALQELEALAEDSTSDCTVGAITRGYDALYLRDMTYPDGSVVHPGKEFVKTWRVANNGVMPWNEKTTLCKWRQVRFRGSPAGWKLKPSMKRVVCPPLEPGQEGDVSITFTAPSEPGWYATHWRFCQRGRVFGNQMWCAIRVEEEPSASGAPESQLEKILMDDTGMNKPSFSRDVVHDLSAAILHDGVRETIFENYPNEDPKTSKIITPPREELGPQNDLGIVENYYDAEDPVQAECIEGLQKLTLSCAAKPDVSSEEKKEKDLITFEEEAEVVDSGSSTPELLPSVSQAQVVPLKEMAKESVESLIHKDQEMKSPDKQSISFINQSDSISMSSGSFSELDSEDQAILNESDSDGSDHEYYVVQLPECFNTNSAHEDSASNENESDLAKTPVAWPEEVDRPDSPDFLTADEDDRTTAVASNSSEDLTCPVNDPSYTSRSSSVSRESDSTNPENPQSQTQVQKGSISSLPDPPTDTKPFMAIPNEALQTNLLYSASQSKSGEQCNQARKDQEPGTWVSGANCQRSVVCEQPYSSQHKETKHSGLNSDGVTSSFTESTTGPATSQMPVDLVGALPDELEMLSPTSDSPGRVYAREEEPAIESPEPAQSSPVPDVATQPEESVSENSTAANTAKETSTPLAPPMQQLEDMGFHNREVNERLLTKYNGDVSCAVAELIILDCH
ncbi:next to BRCA1 gene 1 protein-like isoform X7 [Macrobrachium rosenbergii]|uniref:next to BRCA1 gene 1 protein-like isoform X7 n=1 Tax=Macrobrachium rosenbergii TaxID=79674 RepID=UPI0034D7B955